MSKADLRIDWATHAAAKYACEHWHYTKTIPVGKLVKIGVHEAGRYIGVILFSSGSSGVGVIGKQFYLQPREICELSRVALQSHTTQVTRIIAIAMRFLRKNSPGLRLIVSYADPEQCHHGGIYQGGGWFYTGRSSKDFAYYDAAGKRWHSRSVSDTGYKTRLGKKTKAPTKEGMIKRQLIPKHRYLMPLDDEMRAKIAPLAKPYPKRPKQAESGPPELRQCDTDPDAPILDGP